MLLSDILMVMIIEVEGEQETRQLGETIGRLLSGG